MSEKMDSCAGNGRLPGTPSLVLTFYLLQNGLTDE
jgi:hypothetical protein